MAMALKLLVSYLFVEFGVRVYLWFKTTAYAHSLAPLSTSGFAADAKTPCKLKQWCIPACNVSVTTALLNVQ
jgi:hypothetical protein